MQFLYLVAAFCGLAGFAVAKGPSPQQWAEKSIYVCMSLYTLSCYVLYVHPSANKLTC